MLRRTKLKAARCCVAMAAVKMPLRKTVIPACTIAGLPIWLRLEVPAARTAASALAIASASANLMPCTLMPKQACPSSDASKCTSCGACVNICPRHLFEIRPMENNRQVYVACRNKQKGAVARKNCLTACIACQKCAKINPEIKIENNHLLYSGLSIS